MTAIDSAYTASDATIVAQNLRKTYGTTNAVNDISLTIQRGEIFGLLGPNGAGKTTTIEMIEGLRVPDSGSIQVCGLDPQKQAKALRERIGIALQNSALFPRLTVRQIVRLYGTFYSRAARPDDVIALVGLQEKHGAPTQSLSGGQKQRLALALALVHDPDVLFLDEPTAGLDPQARRGVWDMVETLRAANKTVLLTTHYMDEAEQLCHRVAIVDHGAIIAIDRPAALIARYLPTETIVFTTPGCDVIALHDLPAVEEVSSVALPDGHMTISLRSTNAQQSMRALLSSPATGLVALHDLHMRRATLEDVFLHLTGRQVRE